MKVLVLNNVLYCGFINGITRTMKKVSNLRLSTSNFSSKGIFFRKKRWSSKWSTLFTFIHPRLYSLHSPSESLLMMMLMMCDQSEWRTNLVDMPFCVIAWHWCMMQLSLMHEYTVWARKKSTPVVFLHSSLVFRITTGVDIGRVSTTARMNLL